MASSKATLYFAGRTAEEAVKGAVSLELKPAMEMAADGDKVFALDVTLFSSRLKQVKDA